jgi:hypothetical protein
MSIEEDLDIAVCSYWIVGVKGRLLPFGNKRVWGFGIKDEGDREKE